MRLIAEIVTLFIGYAIWRLLTPYLGFGAFLVGVFVAFIIRPMVQALLGISSDETKTASNKRISQTDTSQSDSNQPNNDEQKGDNQNGD